MDGGNKMGYVELELYTAMDKYNLYGSEFNKTIIEHISNAVSAKIEGFKLAINRVNLDGVDKVLLKCAEVSINCNALLNDLNDTDKIYTLKKSLEELKVIEDYVIKNANEIIQKLNLDGLMKSIFNK